MNPGPPPCKIRTYGSDTSLKTLQDSEIENILKRFADFLRVDLRLKETTVTDHLSCMRKFLRDRKKVYKAYHSTKEGRKEIINGLDALIKSDELKEMIKHWLRIIDKRMEIA